MNLGFKQQFVPKIIEGTKIHTIREDHSDRWGKGATIHFATGIRTKNYKCFKQSECVSTQQIHIQWVRHESDRSMDIMNVEIDGRMLNWKEIKELAINDGFDNVEGFMEWFKENFNGKLIHWTEKRY